MSSKEWRAAHRDELHQYAAAWAAAHPEQKRAARAKWSAAHREESRGRRLMRAYGLTTEAYESLLAGQDGRCAICQRGDPGGRRGWNIDHDHDTGAVRGILCCGCNRMLGGARDEVETLAAAIDYLRETA